MASLQDQKEIQESVVIDSALRPRQYSRVVRLPEGPACVLAIGTAFPASTIDQSTYPDKLFAMCGVSDDKSLKAKFKYMCDTSCIGKRHTFVTPELVMQHPELATYSDASLSTRVAIANKLLPEIVVSATLTAAQEWNRPLSFITHMVLSTTSATSIPGIDLTIAHLLHLSPTVHRICMSQTGCWGGAAALRLGRVLAERARDARVLVIAAEANTVMSFRQPNSHTFRNVDGFLAHATLADGAAALILGSDPIPSIEHPIFEIHHSSQLTVPNSESAIHANMAETGLIQHLQKDIVPTLIAEHLDPLLSSVKSDLIDVSTDHPMFWVVHPGAWKILDVVADTLGLEREDLQASWDVLREFGNCSSPTCLIVLDEMRRRSARLGSATTGGGCEWGFLVGLGPGFTMEVSLLRSIPL